MSCIEALVQASNHETNDDDVDGRTPLLLACLHGHHQAVQVLLSLGGDVTKRLSALEFTYYSDGGDLRALSLWSLKPYALLFRRAVRAF